MQNKWHEHSVGNIVVNFPLSSAIFRAAGIDYCCGGGRLLGEVIKEQRLVDSNIYKALDELAARTEKPAEPFSEMSAERLVEFILTKHHSYLWGALPEAHELIVNVLKAHGRRHPELYDVYKLFGQLSHEMEPHLIREETELRHATNDYSVPCDGCDTFRELYKKLTEIEEDTLQHYHLENNILFKKILA